MKRKIKRLLIFVVIIAIIIIGYDIFAAKNNRPKFSEMIGLEGGTRNIEFRLSSDNYYEVIGFRGKPKKLRIPSEYKGKAVMIIEAEAFYNCTSLKSVTVPQRVVMIGNSAFKGCSNLESITIPFVGGNIDSVYGVDVESVNPNFYYIFGSKLDIPASLKKVTITGGSVINNFAFQGCSSLTSITLPNVLKNVGVSAFEGCSNLESITIPDSVWSIGGGAFSNCSSLASITLPNSVTSIGVSAFEGCKKLKDVHYSGTDKQWNSIYIGSNNEELTDANIRYSHAIEDIV